MQPTDYDSKAQIAISKLLEQLDKSQAILPSLVGTENRDTQFVKPKVGRPKKASKVNPTTKQGATTNDEKQRPQEKRNALSSNERQETQKEIVTSDTTKDLIEQLKLNNKLQKEHRKAVEEEVGTKILWQPHPGPQVEFLSSPEYEVGFFGGRGSGKSDCLLIDPIRFVNNPNFKGLIIRKTMPALREIISRAKKLYPKIKPGTKWKESEKLFEFPSGATIEFGYYDHIDDYDRYHGREFPWLGIDEITQWTSREYYDRIKSVVRSTDPTLTPRIRCTCNPSGPGRIWVKEYFEIEPGVKSKSIDTTYTVYDVTHTISKKYIISTIFDNPSAIENDPQYVAFLSSLPTAQRKQWLDGDFEAVDGVAFEEFDRNVHVIEPFVIPNGWLKIRGIDWGFRSKAVCLWIAFDKEGNAYVYRELVTTKVHSDLFARQILDLEAGEYISYGVMDGQVGVQSGINGPTVEEDFINQGLVNQHADKRAGSRIHSKQLIHKYLRIDEDTGLPKLRIFKSCKQLIGELGSLMIDPHNSEDINQKQEDHAFDALKYALSSRPDPTHGGGDYWDTNKRYYDSLPVVVNSKFGY